VQFLELIESRGAWAKFRGQIESPGRFVREVRAEVGSDVRRSVSSVQLGSR
jgi:hypothetical protein